MQNDNLKFKIFFILIISLFTIHYSLFTGEAYAHCPLCVAGAGAGLTFSRVLGIDDAITGVWVGGFLGAVSFWTQRMLAARYDFFLRKLAGFLLYVLIVGTTLLTFYQFDLVGRYLPIFGVDRLTLGILSGASFFYLVDAVDSTIKIRRQKSLFPYQSVVFSLGGIMVLSLVMYILTFYY